MKTTLFVFLVLFGSVSHSYAGVYKCEVNGKLIYQQMPCADAGEAMAIRTAPATPAPPARNAPLNDSAQKLLEQLESERAAREAERLANQRRQEELRIERNKARAAARQAQAMEEQNDLIRKGYAR